MANTKALDILAKLRLRLGDDVPIRDPYGVLNEVQMDILGRTDFMFLWDDAILSTVAQYTTGTASVNIGSKAVLGVGTVWTDAMVGRKFKFDNDTAWYKIATRTDNLNITFETAYAGSANASGENYKIYQDEYSLASDFDGLSSLPRDLERDELVEGRHARAVDEFVCMAASTGNAVFHSLIGVDADGVYKVRLTPYPTTVERYYYRYRKKRTVFDAWDDELDTPPESDEMVIAGMRSKLMPTPDNIRNFEMYSDSFNADRDKSEVVRYVRRGMRFDRGGYVPGPQYHDVMGAPS